MRDPKTMVGLWVLRYKKKTLKWFWSDILRSVAGQVSEVMPVSDKEQQNHNGKGSHRERERGSKHSRSSESRKS